MEDTEAYFVVTDYDIDDIYQCGYCSRCKAPMISWMQKCPNCGADMRKTCDGDSCPI